MATMVSTDGLNVTYVDDQGVHTVPFGAAVLGGLTDTEILSPNDGDLLTYAAAEALWKNKPSSGGGRAIVTARSIPTSFTQGGVTGPIAVSFAVPFADNNYTVQVTVLGDEVAPETPTLTQAPAVGISYIAFQAVLGVGVNVWITNNDSGAHTGVIHVTAVHD
jgi:hypothetical protein